MDPRNMAYKSARSEPVLYHLPNIQRTVEHHTQYESDEDSHQSIFKFTFAISTKRSRFLGDGATKKLLKKGRVGSSKPMSSNYPNACYFHFEYSPAPSQTYSTDVVIFSPQLAKIYPTGTSSCIVKPVEFQDKHWVVWCELIPIECTDILIEKYANMSQISGLPIKCWANRMKCSIGARFDKPVSVYWEETQSTKESLTHHYIMQILQDLHRKTEERCHEEHLQTSLDQTSECDDQRSITKQKTLGSSRNDAGSRTSRSPRTKRNVASRTNVSHRTNSRDAQLTSSKPTHDFSMSVCLILNPGYHFLNCPPNEIVASKPIRLTKTPSQPLSSSIWLQEGAACDDLLVSWEVSEPLLSTRQRRTFRPLVIQAHALNRLPKGAYIGYEAMQQMCLPLHFTWTWGDQVSHHSKAYIQQENIFFTEMQVLLTGGYSTAQLREILLSKPLIIDLYDRIPRVKRKLHIFGDLDSDYNISKLLPLVHTERNNHSVEATNRLFTADRIPTGRVSLHLSDLITFKVGRIDSSYPLLPLSESDLELNAMRIDTPESFKKNNRGYVGYVDAHCEFRVSVDFDNKFCETRIGEELEDNNSLYEIFVLVVNNNKVVGHHHPRPHLITEIEQYLLNTPPPINGSGSSNIGCGNPIDRKDVLLPNEDNRVHQCSDLKKPTGAHISDTYGHLMIIEILSGDTFKQSLFKLVDKAIVSDHKLYNTHLLHNSRLKFTKRLFSKQLQCSSQISLTCTLESLIANPLLHVRDTVPCLVYCAINRLHFIRHYSRSVMDIFHADQLPTEEMIHALAGAFSAPPVHTDTQLSAESDQDLTESPSLDDDTQTSLDTHEPSTDVHSDVISTNKVQASTPINGRLTAHGALAKSKKRQLYHTLSCAGDQLYNYSMQLLNSNSLARCELWNKVLDRHERYTYCQLYLRSASFEEYTDELPWSATLRTYSHSSQTVGQRI